MYQEYFQSNDGKSLKHGKLSRLQTIATAFNVALRRRRGNRAHPSLNPALLCSLDRLPLSRLVN